MRRRYFSMLIPAAVVATLGGTHTAQSPRQQNTEAVSPLVLRGVTIVDVRNGRLMPDQAVVIEKGRIREVSGNADLKVSAGAQVLDATGKYAIPGLWDMHAHFSKTYAPVIDMPQYLAHGITGVREMDSFLDCNRPPDPGSRRQQDDACLQDKREWQRRIENGELAGPRLLALGSVLINGPPPAGTPRLEPAFLNAQTAQDGRQLARYIKDQGADFAKIYTNVPRDAYFALMDEARQIGLIAAGHHPVAVTLTELSDAGQRSLEHAHPQDFLFACWRGSVELGGDVRRAPPLSAALVQRLLGEFDPALCGRIFATFVKNGTWWVPTVVTERADAYAEESLADPRSRLVLPTRWANWVAVAERVRARPVDMRRSLYLKLREIVAQAYRAGVRVTVGTDAGAVFVFKGSSMHDEMTELAGAGLTPAQVLKAATIDAAEFLGKTDDFGSVEKGKFGDLVILNDNPVADIRNTQKIDSVVFGGRHFDRSALDGLLEGVAKAVKENNLK